MVLDNEVRRVLEYERAANRNPHEMPTNHPGYDVESYGPSGDIERYIEVKATAGEWDIVGVGLTKEEFKRATQEKEKYWLYVVARAEQDDYRIYRIQEPARKVGQFFYDDRWEGLAEKDESKHGRQPHLYIIPF